MAGPRPALAAIACASALGLSACGDSETEISVSTIAAPDGDLAAVIESELDEYSEPFDLSQLPVEQQAQVGAVIDNFPQAAGAVNELVVAGGTVEARTDLEATEGSMITARLICGAILRSVAEVGGDDPGGHRVLGADAVVLADCARADRNFP